MPRLKVTQVRSKVGNAPDQRETLRTLGLKRVGDVVVKEDRPEIRGMVYNPAKIEYQPVNVSTINALFPKGGAVTVDDLYKAGAARRGLPVKVLGNGDISVKVDVAVHSFSKSASEKISAAGGSIKTL